MQLSFFIFIWASGPFVTPNFANYLLFPFSWKKPCGPNHTAFSVFYGSFMLYCIQHKSKHRKMRTMENQDFLTKQLITYLGNKRALLSFIGRGIDEIRTRTGKEKLHMADLFSGSGVVSRYFKQHAASLLTNDLEGYCRTISLCYLSNPDEGMLREVHANLLRDIEAHPIDDGFIRRLYAPKDERNIEKGERVFYTPRNAAFIDTARAAIGRLPADLQPYFLAPLLSEASVKCNTSGVFKGFYKDRTTGIGAYGGSAANALSRILAPIEVPFPIFSHYEVPFTVTSTDANVLAGQMDKVDVAYIDPPYNQHPYGSNYFMLNLINDYKEPITEKISTVSGIPDDWHRSAYNKNTKAAEALLDLCRKTPADFLLISFNSEGFIGREEMQHLLSDIGKVTVFDTTYNTFRGSRNLRERPIHLSELLYLVDKR